MSPHRDDTDLAVDLRALRPQPRQQFVAELDTRAAAGFPKKEGGGSRRGRIASWLDRVPRRRLPAFAGAAATAAIAIATAFVAISEEGTVDRAGTDPSAAPRLERSAAGQDAGGNFDGSGVEFSGAPPVLERAAGAASSAGGEVAANSGPYAARAARREVERSARIVLGTEASEVRSAAARVYEAVHSYDGIVLRSSVRDGNAGQAGAVFDLLVPSGKLGDAMAAFSEIAEVRSRSESTLDVTGPTVGLEERLRDARATVEGLLSELAATASGAERTEVEAELHAERRRLASLRSRLASLQRRTHFSRVSLRIETGTAASDASGGWGVDDAVDEAARILSIAAGVTLIGLAILAPLALLGALAAFARRRWLRVRREQALS